MDNASAKDGALPRLLEKAKTLPRSPGVYIMKNKAGSVIYVGKSRSLRDRVSQYFHGSHDIKTAHMAASVDNFDFIVCDTEMEALILENDLIKQYKPKYNILLKDAKSFPYIKVTVKEEYPRIIMTRKRTPDGNLYFGPYSNTAVVYSVISTLEKTLGIPNCQRKFPRDIGKARPCVYRQLKRCCGVCAGDVTNGEYRSIIDCAVQILRGNIKDALNDLNKRMETAAANERFEEAAHCRDAIEALQKLRQKQKTALSPDSEYDIIALARNEDGDSVCVYYVRSGVISDSEHFVFSSDNIVTTNSDSSLTPFIINLYHSREYIPREILLSFELEPDEKALIESYLTKRSEHCVTLRTPRRGDLKKLCDMAVSDSVRHSESRRARERADERVLEATAQLLRLEVVPEKIEAYDISNFGSDNITAGMITVQNGVFAKKLYRSFKIKEQDTPDDYSAMREAVRRRMSHLGEDDEAFSTLPDLILLDGGRGHVSAVRELLGSMSIGIPVFGMVKDEHHKTRTLVSQDDEISIAREAFVFRFIYKIQDEVHRFTITKMSNAKSKTLKHSSLEKIKGIGPKKASMLLSHFGTLKAMRNASAEEIAAVRGINRADAENIKKELEQL